MEAGVFMTLVPYTIFQIQHDFVDVKTFWGHISYDSPLHLSAFTIPMQLITTEGFAYSFGSDYPHFLETISKINLIDNLTIAIFLLSLIYYILKINKFKVIFLLWLFLGIIFLFTNKALILYEHYFNSILPVLFIVLGSAFGIIIFKIPA